MATNNVPEVKGPLRFKSASNEGVLGTTIVLEADKYEELLTPQAGRFAIEHSGLANGCLSGFGQNVYPVNRDTGVALTDMSQMSGDNVVWRKDFQITPAI